MKNRYLLNRLFFLLLFLVGMFVGINIYLYFMNKKIPEHIYINENQKVVVCMDIPASARIVQNTDSLKVDSCDRLADLRKPITFIAGESGKYTLQINLFGFINYRKIDVEVVDEKYIYPGGFQIGMYLHTDGVLVVNTEIIKCENEIEAKPFENLIAKGDYIVGVNGKSIADKEQLLKAVSESAGDVLNLEIRRNSQLLNVSLQPVKNDKKEYKLGLWVKDDTQGIGTITYIDENNNFAALGHGISDENTGNIMNISFGKLYRTYVSSIIKGKNGTPGELLGAIEYKNLNEIGIIKSNNSNGIYGYINENIRQEYDLNPMKIGYSYEVEKGDALVRFYYKGGFKDYEINIENINNGAEKNLTFKVVSKDLLNLTNGIVQGMSGCPIIQNGKVIGAVTHVFIDDSTKGYGIFIEKMME